MVYDQSLAAVLESTRVRSLIGGGAPWYGEAERYYYLLARRLPGLDRPPGRGAGHAARRGGRAAGGAPGPEARMVVTLLLAGRS